MNSPVEDLRQHVKGNHVAQIEGNIQLLVGGGEGGKLDLVVERDRAEAVGGHDNLHVKGNLNEQADGSASLTVGMDLNTKVGQNAALEAGQTLHIKAGTTLVLEAGMRLSLKVGGNFIDIGPGGISIVGTMVLINSGGSAGSGPGANPEAPRAALLASPAADRRILDLSGDAPSN
jgi:type VI secretion system secreted protein VgrG